MQTQGNNKCINLWWKTKIYKEGSTRLNQGRIPTGLVQFTGRKTHYIYKGRHA